MADGGSERLTFGPIEPLVELMQETPADGLLGIVVQRMKSGTDLRQLVAAAALANARTFGGQDYEGYHAIMALAPAYQMAQELPESRQPLPVLKVVYRNTNHIQQMGGTSRETLHPVQAASLPEGQAAAEALREATRRRDMEGAERDFAVMTTRFSGENGHVKKLHCVRADDKFKPVAGTEFELDADLVLLAMGFVHPVHEGMIENLALKLDHRGNVGASTKDYRTSVDKVFAAGDMRRGQSLVVWAIREGRQAAHSVDKFLMGSTLLPL